MSQVRMTLRIENDLLNAAVAKAAEMDIRTATGAVITAVEQFVEGSGGVVAPGETRAGEVWISVPADTKDVLLELARAFPSARDWGVVKAILIDALQETQSRVQTAAASIKRA